MKLVDLPQEIPLSAYDETREAFLEKYRNIPEILAILEFGTFGFPGISDMDLFVVVPPDTPVSFPHFREYTPLQRYVMGHRHFVITPRTFQFLNYCDPWFIKVDTIYGSNDEYSFVKDSFDQEGYKALSLNFIFLKIFYGSLCQLGTIFSTQEIRVRTLLETVMSYRYVLREFKKLNVQYGSEDPSLPFYEEVVSHWFSYSDAEQKNHIADLLDRFANSIMWANAALLKAMREHLQEEDAPFFLQPRTKFQERLLKKYPGSYIVEIGLNLFVFQKGMNEMRIERVPFRSPLSDRLVYVIPWEFSCFDTPLLFLNGCVSQHYQSKACTHEPKIPVWKNAHLSALFETINRNVWDTRLVRNAKRHDFSYGYAPPRPPARGAREKLGRVVHGIHASCLNRLSHSPAETLFRRGAASTLWQREFPSL